MMINQLHVCSYLRTKVADFCCNTSRNTCSGNSVVRTQVPSSVLQYYPSKTLPSYENVVLRNGYLSSLSYRSKIPNWVAEKFSVESESGTCTRQGINFTDDVEVPLAYRVWKNDFFNTKYSRGHMAAAALHKGSKEEIQHTFYYNDNILPQDFSNNACDWYRLELLSRRMGQQFGEVHIVSGPLWLPSDITTEEMQSFVVCSLPEIGKQELPHKAREVKYDVIGRCQIGAPTHLYKIIACSNPTAGSTAGDGGRFIGVYVTPNAPEHEWKPLSSFKVPLDFVESYSGLNFNGLVDHVLASCFEKTMGSCSTEIDESSCFKKRRELLEKHDLCAKGLSVEPPTTRTDLRLIGARYSGVISCCNTRKELDTVWEQMGKVDESLLKDQTFAYNKKLKELGFATPPKPVST
eukprot:Lankesteria_metandrocarpae@DN1927_c0_g1_i2.p1